MDPRVSWKTLQEHLKAAHRHLGAGDLGQARCELDVALAIDPGSVAARELQDRIASAAAGAAVSSLPDAGIAAVPARPVDSPSPSLSMFEERVRRRRADLRMREARQAIAEGDLDRAASAIEEVADLDGSRPELDDLSEELGARRQRRSGVWQFHPLPVAAAAFALLLFGASRIGDRQTPLPGGVDARQSDIALAPAAPAAEPLPAAEPPAAQAVAEPVDVAGGSPRTSGAGPGPVLPAVAPPEVASPTRTFTNAIDGVPAALPPPPPASAPPAPAPAAAVAAVPAPAAPVTVASAALSPEDAATESITQVLQRYRRAYDTLDAGQAQAVWPTVDRTMLARAFDGLESQTLTFDRCDVRLSTADAATAICQGSARYVPKVGSRAATFESRVWQFELRRARAGDWQIERTWVNR